MTWLLARLRPRRRAGWVWVVLAAGIVANGLRLRDRLARLPVLGPAAAGETDGLMAVVTAEGVTVDAVTLAAATAHARREGLEVVDLVPADLDVEALLDLARTVDTATYRSSPLQPGRGARQAIAVAPDVLQRAELARTEGLDPVEMAQAEARLKQFAPRATDLAVAPGLHAAATDPDRRLATLRATVGAAAPAVAALPLAQCALIAGGAVVSPGWAVAAAVAASLQPRLVRVGTAFTPSDLDLVTTATRGIRLPVAAVRALRSRWQARVVVPTDPRAVEERRPEYAALLAEGTERFFEPRRATCPWCGSAHLTERITTPDLSQHKPGTFTLDECRDCGHVFQNPRLTPEGLDFYYRDFYDGLGADSLDLAFSVLEPAYRARVAMVARAVPAPNRWLDVGGGHGHFCLMAAETLPATRFDMIDLGQAAPDAERRGWVDHGRQGQFTDLAESLAGTYDVVSMHHYLEHTRDPRAELAAARAALLPGGLLLIEVPDPESSWSRVAGPYWGPWLQPQHQHFVPMANLCDELEAQGFSVLDRERGVAHQALDLSSFVGMAAQRLAPPPRVPWLAPPTRAQRAGRVALMAASAPLLAVAFVGDQVLSPVLRDRPGGSNTYRVLARRS